VALDVPFDDPHLAGDFAHAHERPGLLVAGLALADVDKDHHLGGGDTDQMIPVEEEVGEGCEASVEDFVSPGDTNLVHMAPPIRC
jgi:hypothetical protein